MVSFKMGKRGTSIKKPAVKVYTNRSIAIIFHQDFFTVLNCGAKLWERAAFKQKKSSKNST
jgi:hypothetical protein